MRLGWLAVFTLALASCTLTKTEYSRSGVYAGASVVGSVSNFNGQDTEVTPGLGLRAGYRFWDRLAVELAYEGLQSFMDPSSVDVEATSLAVQGKFFPLTGKFQPYVMGGVGYQDIEVTGTSIDSGEALVRIGAGFDWYLVRFLPLFFELAYTFPTGSLDQFEYATAQAGLQIRF